ncbi:MAG: hypothetical protein QG629_839 [Patescibacteria group bacterium]|nr:hypothetical protein [Candidatus Saccharibacteria bacterium]MDQ5963756.1 hypothetical protein [Patescibacteria group bacterium]
MQHIYVLGRQPSLGLAELESLCGPSAVRAFGAHCAIIEQAENEPAFARLGGSTKRAVVLTTISGNDWRSIEKELLKIVRSSSLALPTSGKFHLGLSVIGISVSTGKVNALGLTLKKVIRSRHDGSVRLVPNNSLELSTAQVYHSHLADEHGAEIVIASDGTQTILARTDAVQDIDSYTVRDRSRPMRDARVGMLPPKLAQIIINLAIGELKTANGTERSDQKFRVLDPFCGTGVLLQEALLMGYDAYGTDLEPRMIQFTEKNMQWLQDQYPKKSFVLQTKVGDATTHTWSPQPSIVACESYLGRPFTEQPARAILEQNVSDVNIIIKKFLANIHPQLPLGARLCIAVPAWQLKPSSFRHLPLVDSLEEIGYNRVSFERVRDADLIYYRDDQIVARQLLILTVN